jgi:hypothetical protein
MRIQLFKNVFFVIVLAFCLLFPANNFAHAQEKELGIIKSEIFEVAKIIGNISETIHQRSKRVLGVQTTALTFTRDLKVGTIGEDVRDLQVFLNQSGFPITSDHAKAGSPGKET